MILNEAWEEYFQSNWTQTKDIFESNKLKLFMASYNSLKSDHRISQDETTIEMPMLANEIN